MYCMYRASTEHPSCEYKLVLLNERQTAVLLFLHMTHQYFSPKLLQGLMPRLFLSTRLANSTCCVHTMLILPCRYTLTLTQALDRGQSADLQGIQHLVLTHVPGAGFLRAAGAELVSNLTHSHILSSSIMLSSQQSSFVSRTNNRCHCLFVNMLC